MSLILTTLRCPDASAPETRHAPGGEFSIGRGPGNDWVLADPERHLSKRHCVLAFRSGAWQLADVSSNGTFLNSDTKPVGAGPPRNLRSGDRIRVGSYEIEVTIQEDARSEAPWPQPQRPAHAAAQRHEPSAFDMDPFADAAPAAKPSWQFDEPSPLEPGHGGLGGHSVLLPADFDPLGGEDEFRGPTQADHAPAINDAFRPPPIPTAGIPDDWDLDASRPSAPAFASPPPLPPRPAAVVRAPSLPDDDDLLAPPPLQRAPTPAPVPAPPPVAIAPQPAQPVAAPVASAPQAKGEPALLAAFLRGIGLDDANPADAEKTLELAGAALRAAVSGIRQALIARAGIKGEFRIEQTMVRARGNNPLKFSSDDDDAMSAFVLGRRGSMPPDQAVEEALRDMRLHELATVSAMQSAVRALVAQFDPVAIEAGVDGGGLAVLPGQKRARSWDAFAALHARVSQDLSDDFDSVFGRAFARAYEAALQDASKRENRS